MASSNIEEAFSIYLLANGSLTAIIGTKLEPMKTGQTIVKPYITYEQMESKPYVALSPCAGNVLMRDVYKFNLISDTEVGVNSMQKIFRTLFGNPSRKTMDNYVVAVSLLNGYHEPENPFKGSDVYPYHKAIFLSFQYTDPE